MDQRVSRYETFDALVGYCERSANPVGRLVLAVFDAIDADRVVLSDRVCTGLQLVEHCQDVGQDWRAGRVYIPQEDLRRFGVDESMLSEASANPRLRALMCFEVARARQWITAGRPLVAMLHGWARLAVSGFVAGGMAACDRIAAADYDVLGQDTSPHRSAIVRSGAALWREKPVSR
jgi:phytoene/squalene synthetase